MNGDSKQNGKCSESWRQRRDGLRSISDMARAIKEGDEKYAGRLDVLAELLSDSNANLKRLIEIGTSLEIHLREIRAGVPVFVAPACVTDEEKEIRDSWKEG